MSLNKIKIDIKNIKFSVKNRFLLIVIENKNKPGEYLKFWIENKFIKFSDELGVRLFIKDNWEYSYLLSKSEQKLDSDKFIPIDGMTLKVMIKDYQSIKH